jgi:hypothetical protein
MPSILDPSFRYTPSANTDIRRTFERERARLASLQSAPSPRELLGADDLSAADLHPRLPAWLQAHAADERADPERARNYLDTDTRR